MSTQCECPLAGSCKRHQVLKTSHWHRLCQTRQDYRAKWDQGNGPGQSRGIPVEVAERRKQRETQKQLKLLQAKLLWRELFLSVSTEDDLRNWESKIPKYGCSCSDFYKQHKADNPPTFPLSSRWKYDLKSAVNAKLGHANLTYAEACELWQWDRLPAFQNKNEP